MLLRLAYLGATNALALLRLLPLSDQAKDAEILALRHQVAVLERQLHREKIQFAPADRAFLAALLYRLSRDVLRRILRGSKSPSPWSTRADAAPRLAGGHHHDVCLCV